MTDEQWYWDLRKNRAVRASERGPGEDVMGPYDTKEDAENWREKVEARNEQWDQADREWEGDEGEA
ncbi:MAG: SPOR domain-containing protein [Acidimicrobiia bacterium]|nr:SPOR domain-containing protein [Acidimicrobiia bacterium]